IYLNIRRLPGFDPKSVTSTGVAAKDRKLADTNTTDKLQMRNTVARHFSVNRTLVRMTAGLMALFFHFILRLLGYGPNVIREFCGSPNALFKCGSSRTSPSRFIVSRLVRD